jgi:hypothetical protein
VLGSVKDNRLDEYVHHNLQNQPRDISNGELLRPCKMADGTSSFAWRAQQHQVSCKVANPNGATARVGFPCECSLPSSFLQDVAKLIQFDTHKAKMEESEDSKPAAKPSAAKPAAAAKTTKAKKAAARVSLDAAVSLDCSSISSAVAVTAKKGKDSDDEYEFNCEI